MYDLIVYDSDVDEIENFIDDYFRNPNEIYRNISAEEGNLGDVIISIEDFETSEDLMHGLRSEGFEVDKFY